MGYDDADTIALYMLAAPDAVQMTDELNFFLDFHDPSITHHEESPALQRKFMKDVRNLITLLKEHCNPVLEIEPELFAIDIHDVMCDAVVNSLYQINDIGKVKHETS